MNWHALAAFVLGSATGILVGHAIQDPWLLALAAACLTAAAVAALTAVALHANWSQVFCLHRERDQGEVGFCKHCGHFKRAAFNGAYWTRYVMPPTGPPPQGMPRRRPRPTGSPSKQT